MQSLSITIHNAPDEAPNYKKDHPEFKGAELVSAAVVKNGTEEGKPTIDLLFKDQDGNTYVAMVTGRLLRSVVAASGLQPHE